MKHTDIGLYWYRASSAPVTPAIPFLGKRAPEHNDGTGEDCPRCNVREWVYARSGGR